MPLGVIVLVVWMGFVALFALALLGWGLHSGQFDDVEASKYAMLADTEPIDWPGRVPGAEKSGRCDGA